MINAVRPMMTSVFALTFRMPMSRCQGYLPRICLQLLDCFAKRLIGVTKWSSVSYTRTLRLSHHTIIIKANVCKRVCAYLFPCLLLISLMDLPYPATQADANVFIIQIFLQIFNPFLSTSGNQIESL